MPYVEPCPWCGGDEFGCCACDHTGRIDPRALDAIPASSGDDGIRREGDGNGWRRTLVELLVLAAAIVGVGLAIFLAAPEAAS